MGDNGLYYFKHGRDFIRNSERMINEGASVKGEFYVGPVYNYIISGGGLIVPDFAIDFHPLGSPKELKDFENASLNSTAQK